MGSRRSSGAFPLIAASVVLVSAFAAWPAAALAAEAGDLEVPFAQDQRVALAMEGSPASAGAGTEGIAAGDGWTLDADGVLTIEKDVSKPSDLRYEWGRYAERIREVRLAEGVTAIPNGAFASSSYGVSPIEYPNLTKFTASSTLKTIGWDVFSGTRSLTEVHLNDGLEAVNHSAFANTGITSIVLPDNVTWGGDCFAGCSQLGGTLVIPGGSKFEEGHNATFYGVGVDTVVIEEGVTWIPNGAFNGCANLKRVYLPKSVVQIGDTYETSPGIYYDSFDPCLIVGYRGTAAEQYVEHWLELNPEGNEGLAFHAIDGEEHEFGPWESVSEATCTAEGIRKHSCAICGAERTEVLPALGHAWGEGVVTAEPTESAEGARTFTCGRCGVTRTESIARLEQGPSAANGGKTEGAGGSLPATGDPAFTLGIMTASGAAVAALGEALRRRK